MKKKNSVPQKRMNPALAAITRQRNDNLLISASRKANYILSMIALRRAFGFGEKRLLRFMDTYKMLLDTYEKGEVESIKVWEKELHDKCKIVVELEV